MNIRFLFFAFLVVLISGCATEYFNSRISPSSHEHHYIASRYEPPYLIYPHQIQEIDVGLFIGNTYIEALPNRYHKEVWAKYRDIECIPKSDVEDTLLLYEIYRKYHIGSGRRAQFVFVNTTEDIWDPLAVVYKAEVANLTLKVVPDDGYYFLITPNFFTANQDTFRLHDRMAYIFCLSPMLADYDNGVYGSWVYFNRLIAYIYECQNIHYDGSISCLKADLNEGAPLLLAYYELVLYYLYQPEDFTIEIGKGTKASISFRSGKNQRGYKLTTDLQTPYNFKVKPDKH